MIQNKIQPVAKAFRVLLIFTFFGFILWESKAAADLDASKIAELKQIVEMKKAEVQKKAPQLLLELKEIKFKEEKLASGQKGIRVTGIPNDSLLRKIGLENDDIITGIDGLKVDSPAAGLKLIEHLGKAKSFKLDISRGGINKEIDLKVN